MENKRVTLFNKNKKDTLHDEILDKRGKRNSIFRKSLISENTPMKLDNNNDEKNLPTSKEISSSLSKVSGFDSVIIRKRSYFRRIKRNNQKKSLELAHKQRFDIVTKFILYVFSNVINIISIINYVLQTYFDQRTDNIATEANNILLIIELSTSFYFLFEFVLLFTRVKGSYWKHIFSFDSLIDIITTMPSIISYFFLESNSIRFSFLRMFRIFRVFRILRIYKSLRMIQSDVNSELEDKLVDVKETTNPITLQVFTIFVILFCNFFIFSGLVLGLQELIPNAFNKRNLSFFDAFYYIIVTCSTLGYGDIIPTHLASRMFIICMLFSLVVIISHQVTKLINLLKIWGPGFISYSGSGHIIIICDRTISLRVFLKEIRKKSPNQEVIVISNDITEIPAIEYPFNKVHLINSNSIDLEVLERANTKQAECIFIFSSKDVMNCNQKEKVIDFLILKINRYYSNVTIYVQTLYSERTFGGYSNSNGSSQNLPALLRLNSFIGGSSNLVPGNKNILKYKRIFPILRLKSLIISKALFNPGYPTFMQNLLFNDTPSPIDLDPYDTLMQSYFLGCENKIHIKPFPHFFYNKDFFESVLMVYSKSVINYFRKVFTSDDRSENRPVLLIGVVDKRRFSKAKEGEIRIFPKKFYIKPQTLGIFISYDGDDYLDNFLKKFNDIDIEALNEENKLDLQSEVGELNQIRRRRSGIFERASTIRNFGADFNNKRKSVVKADKFDYKTREENNKTKSLTKTQLQNSKGEEKKDGDEDGGGNYTLNKVDKTVSSKSINSKSNGSDSSSSDSNSHSSSAQVVKEKKVSDNIISQLNSLLCNRNNQKVESPELTKNTSSVKSIKFNFNPLNNNETTDRTKDRNSHIIPISIKSNLKRGSSSSDIKIGDQSLINVNENENDSITSKSLSSDKSDRNLSTQNNKLDENRVNNFFSKYIKHKNINDSAVKVSEHSNNSENSSSQSQSASQSNSQSNSNNSDSSKEKNPKLGSQSFEDEFEMAKNDAFMKRKNLVLRGNTVFSNENTKNNILFLHALEDKNVDILKEKIQKETERRYGKIESLDQELSHEYFIENRIYDVEKNNISDLISGHILIIGYQDNLNKLLKLIMYHQKDRDICIMTNNEADELTVFKLLKQFKSLYYFKGEAQNPFHLLNAGVHKAYSVIFLVETIFKKTNEDMNKILSFKSIDYFFNTKMILELWDTKSTRLIGYQPLNKDAAVVHNEFLHPLFLAGRLIYMSLFEKISAISHNHDYVVDTWIELLSLGFKSTSTSGGFKTFAGNKSKQGFPVLVTINIPETYVGKEYYVLMTDLLCMDEPVIPFGIYIEQPLNYNNERNEGRVSRYTRASTANLKIVTSYKRKLVNHSSVLDKIEQGYMDNLKVLRDISYNDKVVLDYIDVRKPHLPIFITNPPPGFILHDECKILVMHYHQPHVGIKDFQKQYLNNRLMNKRRSTNAMTNSLAIKKKALNNSQENFFFYINKLKNSMRTTYTDAFKILERSKADMMD